MMLHFAGHSPRNPHLKRPIIHSQISRVVTIPWSWCKVVHAQGPFHFWVSKVDILCRYYRRRIKSYTYVYSLVLVALSRNPLNVVVVWRLEKGHPLACESCEFHQHKPAGSHLIANYVHWHCIQICKLPIYVRTLCVLKIIIRKTPFSVQVGWGG